MSWWAVGYHAPTRGLLVAEACRGPQAVRTRIVSVDPGSGRELDTIVRGGWWVVEPDTSGRHLLLLDDRGGVDVVREGERPLHLADGLADIDW